MQDIITKQDIIKIITLMKVNYSEAYSSYGEEEMKTLARSWYDSLKDYPFSLVNEAIKYTIERSEFPPTLATIIKEINVIKNSSAPTDEELWAELSAVLNRVYDISRYLKYAQHVNWANTKLNEIYSGLSDELKLFIVNISTLIEIAEMSSENLQFERARFFKQMPQLRLHGMQKAAAQKFLEQTKTQQALPKPKIKK